MDNPTGIPTSSGSMPIQPNNPLSDLQIGDQAMQQQQPIMMPGMMNTRPNQLLAYDQAAQPIQQQQQQQQPIMMNHPRMNYIPQNMVYQLASQTVGIGSSSSNYEQEMEMLGRKYPPPPPVRGSVILPADQQQILTQQQGYLQSALNMMQHSPSPAAPGGSSAAAGRLSTFPPPIGLTSSTSTSFPKVDWDHLPGNWQNPEFTQQGDAATLDRSNKRKKVDSQLDFNRLSAMSLNAAAQSLQVDVADFMKEAYKKGIYQWLNDSSQYERITVPLEALDKEIMVIVTKCTADKEIDQIPNATRPIRMPGRRPFFQVKERLEQEFDLQASSSSSSAYDTEFLIDGFWAALNNEEHWDFAVKAWIEGRENKAAIHVRIFPRAQLAI